jgi:hypothetical protein
VDACAETRLCLARLGMPAGGFAQVSRSRVTRMTDKSTAQHVFAKNKTFKGLSLG